jgi:hypothetical protein
MRAKGIPCLVLLLCAGVAAEPAQPVAMQAVPLQAMPLESAPAQPASSSPAALTQPVTPLLPKLTDKVIREAVRETLAEPAENPRRYEADTIRGNSYTAFAQQVNDARVPDCLHSDGLKRQPTFFLGGLLALPFIAVAKLRGKCN